MSDIERNEILAPEFINTTAQEVVTKHWENYFSALPHDRLGDEEAWDSSLLITLEELGFSSEDAADINKFAKLEAKFRALD